jgi:Na+/H+ antiporter NhaA
LSFSKVNAIDRAGEYMADQTVGDPRLFHRLVGTLQDARRDGNAESLAAAMLLGATLIALIWANSPWSQSYSEFWHTPLTISIGDMSLSMDLMHWVNDGLMTLFFFVVGLDVKREFTTGELTDRRRAMTPIIAALAGLAVPAGLFLLINPSGEASSAWGVVISTDTAFLLGALALIGPACGARLRVFLLTLAVADDIGALAVIAVVYTDDLRLAPLGFAALGLLAIAWLRRQGAWRGFGYAVVSVLTWLAFYESGVHPTLAGVMIALILPVYPPRRSEVERAAELTRAFRQSPNPEYARAARLGLDRAVSVNERLMRLHEPYTSFIIVPLFALANAGVTLSADTMRAAATSPVTWGIVAGLVAGKFIGIAGASAIVERIRPGSLAPGLRPTRLAGGAALSGIGFTISLFIVDLALGDSALADEARIGVLAATVIATVLGWAIFAADRRLHPESADANLRLLRPIDLERDHVRGPVDAPLTLVEYGDFECPFCSKATGSIRQVREHFGDELRYVFRHLPLEEHHPAARYAAQAAEAAAAQGKFWDMHDTLFRNHEALAPDDIRTYAEELALDLDRFDEDLRISRYAARVDDDSIDAESSDVNGTPTFFIGVGVETPVRHRGHYDAATLIARLEALRRMDSVE